MGSDRRKQTALWRLMWIGSGSGSQNAGKEPRRGLRIRTGNGKLALMPEEILDYLVVHELAHRVEMNHSPAFWAVVAEEIPDYKTRREWLRQNGAKF